MTQNPHMEAIKGYFSLQNGGGEIWQRRHLGARDVIRASVLNRSPNLVSVVSAVEQSGRSPSLLVPWLELAVLISLQQRSFTYIYYGL